MKPHALSLNPRIYGEDDIENIFENIENCYNYHRSTFVFNLSRDNNIKSHCINHLCSDPLQKDFQAMCDNDHNARCDHCDSVPKLAQIMLAMAEKIEPMMADKQKVEIWRYHIQRSEKLIYNWRNFMVRNKVSNQEWSKLLTKDNPKVGTGILDFAMKYEPMKHRCVCIPFDALFFACFENCSQYSHEFCYELFAFISQGASS